MISIVTGTRLVAARVSGQPARAKHACTCRGNHPSTRPDPSWARWRDAAVPALRVYWADRRTLTGPVLASVTAVFQRPQEPRKTYRLHGVDHPYPYDWTDERIPFVGTPDQDQVWKAGLDVMVQAGILSDDRLVVGDGGYSRRWYTAVGEQPSVEVRLWDAILLTGISPQSSLPLPLGGAC